MEATENNMWIESASRLVQCGVSFFILFLLAVFTLPVYIFRFVIVRLATFDASLGSPLPPLSCFFASDLFSSRPPRSNLVISLVFRGTVPFDQLGKRIVINWIDATKTQNGDPRYPEFRQHPSVWMGFYFWRWDPEFNFDNHVYSHPHLGDGIHSKVSEEELNTFTENLLNASFHPSRSPWEIHLVDNYYDKGSEEKLNVLVFKFHHSLADGYSILSAVAEGIFEESLSNFQLPVPHYPKSSSWKERIFLPFRAAYQLLELILGGFVPSPWKISDKKKSWRQSVVKSEPIPISKIKKVKNTFGVGFTSVLVSAISAGAHYDFQRRKQWLPIPFRVADADPLCGSILPVPHHPGGLTNHATMATFPIPVDKFSNVVHRLKKCDEVLENAKSSLIPGVTCIFQKFLGCQPAMLQAFIGKNRMFATGLTNFPSVPQQVKLFDKELVSVDFAAGALQGNAGVAFMVLSYDDNIRLVMTAENGVMSRQEMEQLVTVMCAHIKKLYLFAEAKIQ